MDPNIGVAKIFFGFAVRVYRQTLMKILVSSIQ